MLLDNLLQLILQAAPQKMGWGWSRGWRVGWSDRFSWNVEKKKGKVRRNKLIPERSNVAHMSPSLFEKLILSVSLWRLSLDEWETIVRSLEIWDLSPFIEPRLSEEVLELSLSFSGLSWRCNTCSLETVKPIRIIKLRREHLSSRLLVLQKTRNKVANLRVVFF